MFLGGPGIGAKTSFIYRYITGDYSEMPNPALRLPATKAIVSRGKIVRLELWDTAGSEIYRSLNSMYLRGCDGIVVGYDVTYRPSLEEARRRYSRLKEEHPNAIIMALGNKIDIAGVDRVSSAEGETFANNIHASLFFESKITWMYTLFSFFKFILL